LSQHYQLIVIVYWPSDLWHFNAIWQ